ncbi:MAG: hypothetical protein FWB91_09340 [Defluviitaleaceae bacterium]|nr:hypothetical protein [Defluviitaleaceae bacterium]
MGQFGETRVVMQAADGSYYIFGGYNIFEAYDDYLYIFTANESWPRPDWSTATHNLIEQDGNRRRGHS